MAIRPVDAAVETAVRWKWWIAAAIVAYVVLKRR